MKQLVKAQEGRGYMTMQNNESIYVSGRPYVIERTAQVSVAIEQGRLELVAEHLNENVTDIKFKELWNEDKDKALAYATKKAKKVDAKATKKAKAEAEAAEAAQKAREEEAAAEQKAREEAKAAAEAEANKED